MDDVHNGKGANIDIHFALYAFHNAIIQSQNAPLLYGVGQNVIHEEILKYLRK